MYHIAIVEDELDFSAQLQNYLKQYENENAVEFKISVFQSGAEILKDYKNEYDAIFLDIEMPGINGMETAEKIREMDEGVVLMFITNMAQYAIQGYSVGALDFVMKPINYYTFAMKVKRVLKKVEKKVQKTVVLHLPDGIRKIDTKQIYYIEVQNRLLHYYTIEGIFGLRGTMQSVEEELLGDTFAKCNHWYMVNLAHVKEIKGNVVTVGNYALEISRRNKTAFMQALTDYLGGNA